MDNYLNSYKVEGVVGSDHSGHAYTRIGRPPVGAGLRKNTNRILFCVLEMVNRLLSEGVQVQDIPVKIMVVVLGGADGRSSMYVHQLLKIPTVLVDPAEGDVAWDDDVLEYAANNNGEFRIIRQFVDDRGEPFSGRLYLRDSVTGALNSMDMHRPDFHTVIINDIRTGDRNRASEFELSVEKDHFFSMRTARRCINPNLINTSHMLYSSKFRLPYNRSWMTILPGNQYIQPFLRWGSCESNQLTWDDDITKEASIDSEGYCNSMFWHSINTVKYSELFKNIDVWSTNTVNGKAPVNFGLNSETGRKMIRLSNLDSEFSFKQEKFLISSAKLYLRLSNNADVNDRINEFKGVIRTMIFRLQAR